MADLRTPIFTSVARAQASFDPAPGDALLIGRRCELGRRVLITANLSKDQLWACLGDRVQSRVTQAGLTQNITGKDRRAQEAA